MIDRNNLGFDRVSKRRNPAYNVCKISWSCPVDVRCLYGWKSGIHGCRRNAPGLPCPTIPDSIYIILTFKVKVVVASAKWDQFPRGRRWPKYLQPRLKIFQPPRQGWSPFDNTRGPISDDLHIFTRCWYRSSSIVTEKNSPFFTLHQWRGDIILSVIWRSRVLKENPSKGFMGDVAWRKT